MKYISSGLALACAFALSFVFSAPASSAEEFGSRDDAVAMVKQIQDYYAKNGAEATLKAITDKKFIDRDLYPFAYSFDGVCAAHGVNQAMVGKNINDIRDQSGKFLVREIVKVAKEDAHGWVDYSWPNPVTKKIDNKSSYVERMGDYAIGVGIYNP
jgi:cytochrome c